MITKHLVDIVYDSVKKKYKDKQFPFNVIWKELVKDAKLSAEEQKQQMGDLYTDILQDTRFVYVGNQKWRLREFLAQDEISNLKHRLYDFQTEEINTNDFNDSMLNEEDEEDFDEEQKEVEEDIKSNVSEKISSDEEE